LNFAVRVLYGVRITDEATCYKAFPTDILRAMDLQCERFEFCPEVTAKACRMGLTIHEVPIRYAPRSAAEGKKIRWTDGVEALQTLWRWRQWRQSSVRLRSPLESAVGGPHASAEGFVTRPGCQFFKSSPVAPRQVSRTSVDIPMVMGFEGRETLGFPVAERQGYIFQQFVMPASTQVDIRGG
jgi:hypothetical protein